MTKQSKFGNLVNEDALISVQETPIRMTDEKMKSILGKIYERAQKDMDKKRICDYYDCCFAVCLTLFTTLTTSTFHDFLFMNASFLSIVAKCSLFITGAGGVLLLLWNNHIKREHDTSCRDCAVNEVFSSEIKGNK